MTRGVDEKGRYDVDVHNDTLCWQTWSNTFREEETVFTEQFQLQTELRALHFLTANWFYCRM